MQTVANKSACRFLRHPGQNSALQNSNFSDFSDFLNDPKVAGQSYRILRRVLHRIIESTQSGDARHPGRCRPAPLQPLLAPNNSPSTAPSRCDAATVCCWNSISLPIFQGRLTTAQISFA